MPETQFTAQDRVPKVSRKVRTCTECRRQKVKCVVQADNQSCVRCERNNLACRFNKSLQTILEEDLEAKTNLHSAISRIEKVVNDFVDQYHEKPGSQSSPTILQQNSSQEREGVPNLGPNGVPQLQNIDIEHPTPANLNASFNHGHQVSLGAPVRQQLSDVGRVSAGRVQFSMEGSRREENQLTTDPMRSLYEVTNTRNFQREFGGEAVGNNASTSDGSTSDGDIITRGIISAVEAQELFDYFMTSLNHYLWVGLDNENTTLDSIRCSSRLLALAILTATAMHMPNRATIYDICYQEFKQLVAKSVLSNDNTLEDVRALCIAAFWLPDLSWKLSGLAVRLATELELHTAFFKEPETKETHARARMWYMLYVCDHHFAIAYGRPPMVQTGLQIQQHERFLESPYADTVDFRLLSQVALFAMFMKMRETLCENASKLTVAEMATMVREYNIKLDQWRLLWEPRQAYNKFIGSFPPQGNVLYYQFAKLQLNVIAIPYISSCHAEDRNLLNLCKKEFVNLAATAAFNILDLLLEDPWMRKALVGVPLFVHTMLTFTCLFLFKLGTQWNRYFLSTGFAMDLNSLCQLIDRVVHCIRTSTAGERHIVHHIASGLDKMIAKLRSRGLCVSQQPTRQSSPVASSMPDSTVGLRQQQQQQQQDQINPVVLGNSIFPSGIEATNVSAMTTSSNDFAHASSGMGPGSYCHQQPHAAQSRDMMSDMDLVDMIESLGGAGNIFPFDEVNFWAEDV